MFIDFANKTADDPRQTVPTDIYDPQVFNTCDGTGKELIRLWRFAYEQISELKNEIAELKTLARKVER